MEYVQTAKDSLVKIGELYQDLKGNCAGKSDEDKAALVKECIINVRVKQLVVDSELKTLLSILSDKEVNYLSRINAW